MIYVMLLAQEHHEVTTATASPASSATAGCAWRRCFIGIYIYQGWPYAHRCLVSLLNEARPPSLPQGPAAPDDHLLREHSRRVLGGTLGAI